MSMKERMQIAWAEWAPSYRKGRFEVGGIIVMSRAELGRTSRSIFQLGVDAGHGGIAAPSRESLAPVRHLHSV